MASQQLTKAPAYSVPNQMPPTLWNHFRYSLNGCIGGEVPHDRALEVGDRQMLDGRAKMIEVWLKPSGAASVKEHIAHMFMVMPHRNLGELDGEIMVRIYCNDLGDLPVFAIAQACENFRKGAAGDGKWAPTIAEIRAEVAKIVEPWHRERAEIFIVLGAKPLPPPPKKSIKEVADALIAELDRKNELSKEALRATAEKDVLEGFPHLRKPLTVSDELRASNTAHAEELRNAPIDE